jgi:hypothetical protein
VIEPVRDVVNLSSCTVLVVKCLDETDKVRRRSKQDQNMEDLMRTAPDVESARLQAFRESSLRSD